jgi:pimeloyl-ACP methyl ester carboxylesterase
LRLFEVALTIALVLAALIDLTSGSRRIRFFLTLFCLALFAIHLIYEGGHWQMLPVYLAVLILIFQWRASKIPNNRKIAASFICILCVISGCLSYAIPMFSLPKPTGPYPVGTRILYMHDDSRKEDAGTDRGRPRELMVQVWYPAAPSKNHLAPYRRWSESKLKNSYQSVLWTNSRQDAPIASEREPFPLILFGHGWGATRISDTFLAEDLASHGYVIVAADHPYNSGRVALPDGRVISGIVNSPIINVGNESAEKTEAFWNMELQKWTADEFFVLNSLQSANLDPRSFWYKHLNTNLVGALGHSFGGSAALRICSLDPRVRSAINLDGWTFDGIRDRSSGKPIMFMYEANASPQSAQLKSSLPSVRVNAELDMLDSGNVLNSLEKFGGYKLTIAGAMHADFTDQSLVSPFRRVTYTGPIKAARMHTIVRDYALAFFNKTLRGGGSPLLDSGNSSPFSEVHFEQWPAK